MSLSTTKKKTPAIGLPSGWVREECIRQTGLSRGKSDIYYYSPSGKKIRSKPELIRLIGSSCDLSGFDYRSGRILPEKAKSSRGHRSHDIKSGRIDLGTSVPNRRTASIFKQPVTKETSHRTNKVKCEQTKAGGKAPQQLFREKRLTGLQAVDIANTIVETMDLPEVIQAIGTRTTSEELLQRIASQLHHASTPITGQTSSMVAKDPCVWLNAQQPICKSFRITEEDIRKQEYRVLAARERLEQAIEQDRDLQRKELMILV